MTNLQKAFKTGKGLQGVLDNLHNLPDAEDVFDNMFFEMFEINPIKLSPIPYWLANFECNDLTIMVEYHTGYHETYFTIGDIIAIEGKRWKYIDTQLLTVEVEHQAEDGSLVYEYRGQSFLRILELIDRSNQ